MDCLEIDYEEKNLKLNVTEVLDKKRVNTLICNISAVVSILGGAKSLEVNFSNSALNDENFIYYLKLLKNKSVDHFDIHISNTSITSFAIDYLNEYIVRQSRVCLLSICQNPMLSATDLLSVIYCASMNRHISTITVDETILSEYIEEEVLYKRSKGEHKFSLNIIGGDEDKSYW